MWELKGSGQGKCEQWEKTAEWTWALFRLPGCPILEEKRKDQLRI